MNMVGIGNTCSASVLLALADLLDRNLTARATKCFWLVLAGGLLGRPPCSNGEKLRAARRRGLGLSQRVLAGKEGVGF